LARHGIDSVEELLLHMKFDTSFYHAIRGVGNSSWMEILDILKQKDLLSMLWVVSAGDHSNCSTCYKFHKNDHGGLRA
jgi:hypothetical protein